MKTSGSDAAPGRKLHSLTATANGPQMDQLLAILTDHAPYGWEERQSPEGFLIAIVHAEDASYLKPLAEACVEHGINAEPGEAWIRDPLEAWKEFFTPVVCGSRFVVVPPWLAENDFGQPAKILIEPKSAFGTGHHASTALCLEALSLLLDGGSAAPGQTFLDLGCGSGVLGIGASLAGLKGVACDVDPLAIDNARENVRLNGIEMELVTGSLEALGCRKFDLVLANILAGPLIEMAPGIIGLMREKPRLILSGILTNQAGAVAEAYQALGAPKMLHKDEWASLIWS